MNSLRLVAIVLLASAFAGAAPTPQSVCGVVVDPTNKVITGAQVQVDGNVLVTGNDGRFCLADIAVGSGVRIDAPGFAAQQVVVTELPAELKIKMQLVPAVVKVIVSAKGPVPQSHVAESIDVLSEQDLAMSSAPVLDEKLRSVAGFSLFRRSSSRTANPSTQGASLRGIGATAASRVSVVSDGVPLTDPFGGWVYWDRIPESDIASVEVLSGGGSHLYGSGAMGGVIEVIPNRDFRGITVDSSIGSNFTSSASLLAGIAFGRWAFLASVEGLRTNGYIPVAPQQRGMVDTPAMERYGSGNVRIRRILNQHWTAMLGGDLLNEGRDNGTQLQVNSTRLASSLIGADYVSSSTSFTIRAYGQGQRFVQTFSAVAQDRNSETLTRWDRVPSQREGASASWFRSLGRQTLTIGADFTHVRGVANGLAFVGPITRADAAGGRLRAAGTYVRDAISIGSHVTASAGARFDRWRNYDGFQLNRGIINSLGDRNTNAVSPDLSVLVNAGKGFLIHAAAYAAFRAPTLQELYRGFRVGNIVTLANENLEAEHLHGAEVGFTYSKTRLTTRTSLFWNRVRDPIISRTISTTPRLITRQRDNLGQTGTFGVETNAELRISRIQLRASYQFADAQLLNSPGDVSLVGKFIPQVPRHAFAASCFTKWRSWNATVQLRGMSSQFDDDLNQFSLHPFAVTDVRIGRNFGDTTEAYIAAENTFNSRYEIGRTPTPTLGPGALVRLGIRVRMTR